MNMFTVTDGFEPHYKDCAFRRDQVEPIDAARASKRQEDDDARIS